MASSWTDFASASLNDENIHSCLSNVRKTASDAVCVHKRVAVKESPRRSGTSFTYLAFTLSHFPIRYNHIHPILDPDSVSRSLPNRFHWIHNRPIEVAE